MYAKSSPFFLIIKFWSNGLKIFSSSHFVTRACSAIDENFPPHDSKEVIITDIAFFQSFLLRVHRDEEIVPPPVQQQDD